MKNFLAFITEASRAATQAKAMGLTGDGHGDYYDKEGNLIAKTVRGQLKIFQKKTKTPDQETQKQQTQQEPDNAPPVEKTKGALTIGFGRFNPPTTGHEKLINNIRATAGQGEYKIYPSHSEDPKKNPLDSITKVEFMKTMFPDHANNIVHDTKMRTIFDVLKGAHNDGHTEVNIVVGADRQAEFENLANKYNGKLYSFEKINVISAGARDPDSEGVEGMSASKMRKAAAEGDFETFASGLPGTVKPKDAETMFLTVRQRMGIEEGYELWQIAPKYDWKGLRENFVLGNVFKVGSLVENLVTGFIGKIIRKGTNHIISVTKEGYLFKSWIKDVNEVHEIGTDSYREYVQGMSPREKVQSFINKSKKKRNRN
tara:strand:+ start:2867 stop:3979 length:1113 start_codon:yes stop_codon:yes gene_type:complete